MNIPSIISDAAEPLMLSEVDSAAYPTQVNKHIKESVIQSMALSQDLIITTLLFVDAV